MGVRAAGLATIGPLAVAAVVPVVCSKQSDLVATRMTRELATSLLYPNIRAREQGPGPGYWGIGGREVHVHICLGIGG